MRLSAASGALQPYRKLTTCNRPRRQVAEESENLHFAAQRSAIMWHRWFISCNGDLSHADCGRHNSHTKQSVCSPVACCSYHFCHILPACHHFDWPQIEVKKFRIKSLQVWRAASCATIVVCIVRVRPLATLATRATKAVNLVGAKKKVAAAAV